MARTGVVFADYRVEGDPCGVHGSAYPMNVAAYRLVDLMVTSCSCG